MGYKFATVKIADIDTLLNGEERDQLYRLLNLITDRRVENGKKYNRYLVINQDEHYAPAVLNLMKQQGHWENSDLELHPKNPIGVLCDIAHQNAVSKGWWDEERSFGEIVALIHSEVSEALEDYRNGHNPSEVWYEVKVAQNEEPFRMSHEGTPDPTWKPCGIPSELADIVIRVFDACGRYGIDLEKAISEKMAYNATRPQRHGGKVI